MSIEPELKPESLGKARVIVPDNVVHRAFDSETVLLNLTTGRYHGLDEIGGRILAVLVETGSPERAAESLAREFEQPLARTVGDVATFCNQLAERGLIEIHVADD